jgi:hypothetical protein
MCSAINDVWLTAGVEPGCRAPTKMAAWQRPGKVARPSKMSFWHLATRTPWGRTTSATAGKVAGRNAQPLYKKRRDFRENDSLKSLLF